MKNRTMFKFILVLTNLLGGWNYFILMYLVELKFLQIFKALYYVSLIDDYSRLTWIYFLKTKFEVFSWFKEIKSLLENHTFRNIKVLRTNNGGKFDST